MDESTAITFEPDQPASPVVTAMAGQGRAVESDQGRVSVSVIMPTVFWTGTFERCARRVLSLLAGAAANSEVIVAFDGDPAPAPAWLDRPDVRIVKTDAHSGPAIARNLAAQAARGEILFFVDADVELAPGAIDHVLSVFEADPDCVALFGAYDDEPATAGVASVFRNLLQHHKHLTHPGRVDTFWAGCGAIRTAAFLDIGGFDETLAYPSVEDIELGMRVAANGGKIRVVPELRCKHLKHWTLASMVLTDIVHRARPWSQLIVNSGHIPATLSLGWRARCSGVCAVLLVAFLAASPFLPAAAWAVVASGLALFAMNNDFYRLCARRRGFGFGIASFGLHVLYFVYSSLTFGAVLLQELWFRSSRSTACPSSIVHSVATGRGTTAPSPTRPSSRGSVGATPRRGLCSPSWH